MKPSREQYESRADTSLETHEQHNGRCNGGRDDPYGERRNGCLVFIGAGRIKNSMGRRVRIIEWSEGDSFLPEIKRLMPPET